MKYVVILFTFLFLYSCEEVSYPDENYFAGKWNLRFISPDNYYGSNDHECDFDTEENMISINSDDYYGYFYNNYKSFKGKFVHGINSEWVADVLDITSNGDSLKGTLIRYDYSFEAHDIIGIVDTIYGKRIKRIGQ